MLFCRILIISLTFAISISAFNPFKKKKVEVYNNIDNSAVEEENIALKESLYNLLNGKCAAHHINASVPDWLSSFNHNYRCGVSFNVLSENSNADILIVLNYKRKSVFGLSGDIAFAGWIGDDFSIYSPGGGGMSISSAGVPIAINVTDENPEWQYQSTIELDIFDCLKKEKIITIIRTHEASSDTAEDFKTLSENIDEVFEEIDDVIYKKVEYTKFKRIMNDSLSVRSPKEINDRITASLIHVFSEMQSDTQTTTINKSVVVDEYGNVSLANDDSSGKGSVIDDMLTDIHLQRVIKAGDTAKFKPVFKISRYFGKNLTNGYYCSVSGVRDSSEVWNILYHYLDEFIKHQDSFNADQRVAHVTFLIKPDGTIGNEALVNSVKMESIGEKILEEIRGWNFGDKTHLISESTIVEFVCTFSKDKNSIRMKK